jgi:hypothetical protein
MDLDPRSILENLNKGSTQFKDRFPSIIGNILESLEKAFSIKKQYILDSLSGGVPADEL